MTSVYHVHHIFPPNQFKPLLLNDDYNVLDVLPQCGNNFQLYKNIPIF